ncbi:hypothetical protein LA6_000641 [Marinibacterium anthonyi]|nr:hypothetical protein LA6_000641 [Marinibacterium anthonyi]
MTNSDDFGFGGAIPDGWSTGSLLDYIRRGLQEPSQALVFPDINLINGAPGAWPIRDQGKIRSTCNAFAVVAAEELYLWRQTGESRPHMLSEEFVYNRMRLEYEPTFSDPTKPPDAGVEAGGTFLDEAAQVLKNDGICAASLMPYQRHIDFGPAHTVELHPNALDDAAARKTEVVVNGWTGPRFDMDPDKWRKPLNGRILSATAIAPSIPVLAH